MTPPKLGTILPTAASLKADADYGRRDRATRARIAAERGLRGGVVVGTETQYHAGNVYRIVGRDGRVRVFEKSSDGDRFLRYE